MNANKQQGFTIIELVVVILLLGILTATALPRFMDVTDEAHEAVVEGVLGGMASGVGMYRAQWYGEGQPSAGSTVFGFGAGDLAVNSVGYPVGSANGTLDTSSDCAAIYRGLLQPGGRPSITSITASAAAMDSTDYTAGQAQSDFLTKLLTSASGSGVCEFAYTSQFRDPTAGAVHLLQLSESGDLVKTVLP